MNTLQCWIHQLTEVATGTMVGAMTVCSQQGFADYLSFMWEDKRQSRLKEK